MLPTRFFVLSFLISLASQPLQAAGLPLPAMVETADLATTRAGRLVLPIAKFDHDKREDLTAEGKPWTAIGKLTADSGRSNCTAQLVARDMILTNAHCVVAKGKVLNRENFVFMPLFRKGKSAGRARVIQFWVGTLEPLDRRQEDWAILKLNKPLGDKLGWFDLESHGDDRELVSISSKRTLYSVGYSIEYKELQVPYLEKNCGIRYAYADNLLGHDCSNGPGASGQSLFTLNPTADGDRASILAISLGEAEIIQTDIKNRKKIPGAKWDPSNANIAIPTKHFKDAAMKIIEEHSEKK